MKKRFKSQFTIRKRKHDRHPNAIVDANKTQFSSMVITHANKDHGRFNMPLSKNPNPKDTRKAYVKKKNY